MSASSVFVFGFVWTCLWRLRILVCCIWMCDLCVICIALCAFIGLCTSVSVCSVVSLCACVVERYLARPMGHVLVSWLLYLMCMLCLSVCLCLFLVLFLCLFWCMFSIWFIYFFSVCVSVCLDCLASFAYVSVSLFAYARAPLFCLCCLFSAMFDGGVLLVRVCIVLAIVVDIACVRSRSLCGRGCSRGCSCYSVIDAVVVFSSSASARASSVPSYTSFSSAAVSTPSYVSDAPSICVRRLCLCLFV